MFELISKLQEEQTSADYKAEVLLVRDTTDGLFKILKSYLSYKHLKGYLNEDELELPNLSFFPRYYGISILNNKKYIRRSYMYGQLLSDYCYNKDRLLPEQEVRFIICDLATKLIILQDHLGVLFLDLRPENILITSYGVAFFDLGLSRRKSYFDDLYRMVDDAFFIPVVSHPRFTAPEIVSKSIANSKSIIFQLGLIAHELLHGRHPFDTEPNCNLGADYGIKQYIMPYTKQVELNVKDTFIKKMLSYDIEERPLLSDCVYEFESPIKFIHRKNVWRHNSKTVLFPARMGIPHKGHIKFMTNLLDLGFKLLISIQRSYTLTEDDPIPKWLVLKMVAQSLLEQGYPEESFKLYLTPFYNTNQEFALHFAMFPEKFNLVASSNESIEQFFPHMMICQRDVLGFENVPYADESWGKIIRAAVDNKDYGTFKKYAASGVEKILSFEEISKPGVEEWHIFSNNVFVRLYGNDFCIIEKKISRYSTPELALGFPLLDVYDKEAKIIIKNITYNLVYDKVLYQDKKCVIEYRLNPIE